MAHGKRGCSLSLAFGLHVLGLTAMLGGCLSPFWSRITDETIGNVTNKGLVTFLDSEDEWTFKNFNEYMEGSNQKTDLYEVMCVSIAFLTIFVEFFLVQAYAFACYNKSCGKKYNPDVLMVFSLLTGFMAIACLVLYEQWIGRTMTDVDALYKFDYSRGLVIVFIATTFIAAFFTVCDRIEDKNKIGDRDY